MSLKLVKATTRFEVAILQQGNDAILAAIYVLWQKMCQEAGGYPPKRPELWLRETAALMDLNSYLCFVVFDGSVIVGFLDLILQDDPIDGGVGAIGRHLYVEPEYRKTAAGRLLLLKCMRSLKRGNIDYITSTPNIGNIEMFKALGFISTQVQMRKAI